MVSEPLPSTVNIVCVGNALHGDDGLGEAVFEAMRVHRLPESVRLMRVPFVGPDALACFEHCARVIVVDALQGFGAPGSVHALAPDNIAEENAPVGHGVGLGSWLAQLPQWLEEMPSIEVIGVEAETMAPFAPGLSPSVMAVVPQVCKQVFERATHG